MTWVPSLSLCQGQIVRDHSRPLTSPLCLLLRHFYPYATTPLARLDIDHIQLQSHPLPTSDSEPKLPPLSKEIQSSCDLPHTQSASIAFLHHVCRPTTTRAWFQASVLLRAPARPGPYSLTDACIGPFNHEVTETLKLENPNNAPVAFKVRRSFTLLFLFEADILCRR